MRGSFRASSTAKRALLARVTAGLMASAAIVPIGAGTGQAVTGPVRSSSFVTSSAQAAGPIDVTIGRPGGTRAGVRAPGLGAESKARSASHGGGSQTGDETSDGGTRADGTGGGSSGSQTAERDGSRFGSGSVRLAFTGLSILLIPGLLGGLVLLLVGTGLVSGDRWRTLRSANDAPGLPGRPVGLASIGLVPSGPTTDRTVRTRDDNPDDYADDNRDHDHLDQDDPDHDHPPDAA